MVPGDLLIYVLSYQNVGNQDATGVVITETLPANTTFVAASSTLGWAFAGNTATLTIGNVAAGVAAQSVTFAVRINTPVASGVEQITNTASITDDGTNGIDPTPANNTSTDTDTLDAQPDLVIVKTAGSAMVLPGNTLVYTLTYSNVGNQNATGVVITETVPANTTFLPASSTAGWVLAGNSATFTVGALTVGAPAQSVTFVVQVAATIPAGTTTIDNTATIDDDHTNGNDPTPPNNTSTVTTRIRRPICRSSRTPARSRHNCSQSSPTRSP